MPNGVDHRILAKDLIRTNRRFLVETIAGWTGAREKVVAPVIIKFYSRSRDLGLYLPQEEESFRLASLTALGTTVVMNYLTRAGISRTEIEEFWDTDGRGHTLPWPACVRVHPRPKMYLVA